MFFDNYNQDNVKIHLSKIFFVGHQTFLSLLTQHKANSSLAKKNIVNSVCDVEFSGMNEILLAHCIAISSKDN